MDDQTRNLYIDCAIKAIVKAGLQLRERLGVGFTGVPFYAPGGHEITAESIDVESALESEFEKGQLSYDSLRKRTKNATLLNITESSDIKKVLSERWGQDILAPNKRDDLEFVISDCPDGSTKHGNFSKASIDGLPLAVSPPTTINMTLYEHGTTFDHIRAHITYALDGDLVIVRKNDNNIVEFLMYENVRHQIPENAHPRFPSAKGLREIYGKNSGTICAAIMTNDNFGCMGVSEEVRQNLHQKCNGISRVRFESTGSSILDQHLSIYRNYSHLLIDLRGLFPEDGAVLHPAEAGAHYLAFRELGWDCLFRNKKSGKWDPLGKFDILDENYSKKRPDGSTQYELAVAYYSPNIPNAPNVKKIVTDSVNKAYKSKS